MVSFNKKSFILPMSFNYVFKQINGHFPKRSIMIVCPLKKVKGVFDYFKVNFLNIINIK